MTSPAVGVQPSHAIFAVIFLDPSTYCSLFLIDF